MTEEEFYQKYGRYPIRTIKKKKKVKVYWGRIFIALVVLLAVIMGIVKLINFISLSFKNKNNNEIINKTNASPNSSISQKDNNTSYSKTGCQFTVCIDAGHGRDDAGTTNDDGTRIEKDDNLKVSLEVQKELKAQGVNVIMIRTTDSGFMELGERCTFANEHNADLFVSLHRNSYQGPVSGVEVWVNNDKPSIDNKLASNILLALENVGISENRGVQYGYVSDPSINYYVNADTKMPSCLVELGFLTNDEDNRLFDEKYVDYGKAIANAIIQTAKDVKLIDENGARLQEGMLISKEKYINRAGNGKSNETQTGIQETTPANTDTENIYNTQETEYER